MFLGCINNHRSHCVGKFELNVLQEKVLSWNEDNCRRLPAFKILGFNCDVIGGSRRQVIEFKGSIVTGNGGPAVSGIIPFEYDGRARDDIPVNIGHCAADDRCPAESRSRKRKNAATAATAANWLASTEAMAMLLRAPKT